MIIDMAETFLFQIIAQCKSCKPDVFSVYRAGHRKFVVIIILDKRIEIASVHIGLQYNAAVHDGMGE